MQVSARDGGVRAYGRKSPSRAAAAVVGVALVVLAAAAAGLACAKDDTAFRYRTYAEIVQTLRNTSAANLAILKLDDAQSRFRIGTAGQCEEFVGSSFSDGVTEPVECKQYYVTLTNHATWSQDKTRPQMLISGELHGNERVGPHVSVELILMMVKMYALGEGEDSTEVSRWIRYLIDHRVLVIMPMANAVGFEMNHREEVQDNGHSFDPNRDFPFNQKTSACMQTFAARAINELFRAHMFQLMITFHGGTNVIGYEWGDYGHCSETGACEMAPDHALMDAIGARMKQTAGPAGTYEREYTLGSMGSTVYPVNGGMEDWAYGASWTGDEIQCNPVESSSTYAPKKTARDPALHRCVTYLVETGDQKIPDEGSLGTADAILVKGGTGDGHIPRNIRLSIAALDALQPYARVVGSNMEEMLNGRAAKFTLRIVPGGLFTLDAAYLQWSTTKSAKMVQSGATDVLYSDERLQFVGSDGSVFPQRVLEFDFFAPLPLDSPIYFRAVVLADSKLVSNDSQSHLAGARSKEDWSFSANSFAVHSSAAFVSATHMISFTSSGAYLMEQVASDPGWGFDGDLYANDPSGGAGNGARWAGVDKAEGNDDEEEGDLAGTSDPMKSMTHPQLLKLFGIIFGCIAAAALIVVGLIWVLRTLRKRAAAARGGDRAQEMETLSAWEWSEGSSENEEV
ncbi:Carboxypeptidase D [Porphyridium purpureum]|uniref:Carboxypeptidase D n=1 Tax=Porphyridium purpureum TaxID=35688 RepID=A0A5J4Z005_PORPP|nr:Carboxypeptidase D [Porphyridium purpureum]|eukprot:POR9891..scf208_2